MSSSSAVSLPPQSIRVKRQRTEEPVAALYIENAKRRRMSKEFIFRLARTVDSPAGDREVPPSPKKLASPVEPTNSNNKDVMASPVSDAMSISPTLPAKAPQQVASSRLQRPQTPTPMVTTTGTGDGKGKSMDPDLLSPGTKHEIRRFHLSKRVKLDPYGHGGSSGSGGGGAGGGAASAGVGKKRDRNVISVFMEGSGRVAKKRSLGRLEYVKGSRDASDNTAAAAGTPKIKFTGADDDKRKPKTHPREKAMIEQRKSREHSRSRENEAAAAAAAAAASAAAGGSGSAYYTPQEHRDDWALETDELTQQLQAMVMDYIANQPGIENLTPTNPGGASPPTVPIPRKKRPSPASSMRAKKDVMSGEIGPAKAIDTDHTKLSMDSAASAVTDTGTATGAALDTTEAGLVLEDAEGDWVYDVYVREELKPEVGDSGELVRKDEEYGVLVIGNSDDEEWWYDQDDDDSDSKAFGSDDEDSNAEDYHTNDYPDEQDDEDSEPEYEDEEAPRYRGLVTKGGRKITTADDEEYDLNDYADDESDGDEEREGRMRW